jgi:hypothetical protein
MAQVTSFRFDRRGLENVLQGRRGPVARDLGKRAIRVLNEARLNATGRGVEGAVNPEGRGPNVDTGRLRSSLAFVIDTDSEGLYADVGTNVPYGYYLETGLRNGNRYPFLVPALVAV